MRRKVLSAVICWLTLSETFGETNKTVKSSIVDNESAESAPRLYRNVPLGVYASAAPYAAYSFQIPSFITAPRTAASRIIPVREQIDNLHNNNNNGYLRDSYGNRFVDTRQTAAYKTAFPQQFVPLQELPAHLAQPLLATAPQNRQISPHYFVAPQYRLPTFQIATNNLRNNFGPQTFVYAQNVKSLTPPSSSLHTQVHGVNTAQQQPSSNKVVYTNFQSQPVEQFKELKNEPKFQRFQAVEQLKELKNEPKFQRFQHVEQFKEFKNEPKFQRLENSPEESYKSDERKPSQPEDKAQIQAAAAKTAVTAIVNGEKTVIHLDSTPPLPLLDLSLLEPLTFANPLVPQVQHFLPRISQATYHKLPEFNVNEPKQQKKEFVVQKSKIYDTGIIKGKPHKDTPKKNPKLHSFHHDHTHGKQTPTKSTVIVKGTPNENPEIVYEINSPNYKETYKEKSVSYDKNTASEPVNYSYNEKSEAEPVHYSYERTEQKEPVTYNIVHTSNKEPVHVTQVSYQGQGPRQLVYTFKPDETNRESNERPAESDNPNSSENSGSSEDERPAHRPNQHENHEQRHEAPRHIHYHDNIRPEHRVEEYHHRPNEEHHVTNKQNHHITQNVQHHHRPNHEYQHKQVNQQITGQDYHHVPNQEHNNRPNQIYHQKPNHDFHQRSNGEYHYIPNEQVNYKVEQHRSREHSPPHRTPVNLHPQQYEEDIHLLPPHHNAPIKVDPTQHVQQPKSHQEAPAPNSDQRQHIAQQPLFSGAPVIHEKAKRIIIKDESPDEMHMHQEQITAEVIDQEDNNEEDFEKAYKDAAFGFPAFEKKAEDIEKDIYDPASYGFQKGNEDFNAEKTPFQDYQAEGDNFPKLTRLNYNDAKENNKEDYYLDYSINRPESLSDRYKNKAEYFKLYKQYKPEKKEKKEKYTVAPSFDFEPAPKQKPSKYFAEYKAEPIKYEYDYSKGTPRDNSAYASHPYQRLKSKTHFVEPQFQYGFEPISLPRLLDSELAAMATNDSPESEKPGMRKKIYEENWYIKKTSTSAGKPS